MFSQKKNTLFYTLVLLFSVLPNFCVSSNNVNFQIYVEDVPDFQAEQDIRNSKGETIFQVRFNKDSNFSNLEAQSITDAFYYWSRILKKADNGIPAIIEVAKTSLGANSQHVLARYWGEFLLDPLINGKSAFRSHGKDASRYNHAYIEINGDNTFSFGNGDAQHPSLSYVMIHEGGHGVFPVQTKTGGRGVRQVVGAEDTALPGIDYDGHHVVNNYRSLMYPQYHGHLPFLFEPELIFLQKQGWPIDLKDFVGESLYQNNQNLVNDKGYSKRNSDGTGYIQDYNPNSFRIGYYINGNKNRVLYDADILTKGRRSRGIWIDGENNELTINHMRKIHANGRYGVSLLIEGANNWLTIRPNAEIYAKGPHGIGVSLNGKNVSFDLNKDAEIHADGIYGTGILVSQSVYEPLLLNGEISALGKHGVGLSFSGKDSKARMVYVNGTLLGREKALYIDKSASVRDVKIASGARVEGDIVVEDYDISVGWHSRLTHVTFGYDSKFLNPNHEKKTIYSHTLKGENRLKVEIEGSVAFYNSRPHTLESLTVLPQASLEANGEFRLAKWENSLFYRILNQAKQENRMSQQEYETHIRDHASVHRGYFYNQGQLSPSSKTSSIGNIIIDGSFWQDEKGTLTIDIDKNGRSDKIHVTQDAHLGGTLEIRPEEGFLDHNWGRDFVFLTTGGHIRNDFHAIKWPSSPTLKWESGNYLGFESVKERNFYGVRLSQTPSTHNPQLDPNYKSELESIQKRQIDTRLNLDDFASGEWSEFKRQERLSLDLDSNKRTQVRNEFFRQLSNLRAKVSTLNIDPELYPEEYNQNKEHRENYENFRVSFIAFHKEISDITKDHKEKSDALDKLYTVGVLSPEQNQEAENYRKSLKNLRDSYNNLLNSYNNFLKHDGELNAPLSLKADSETDPRHTLSEDLFIFNELFPKIEHQERKSGLTVKIPKNAYSQYAATDNEREVGVVLDKLRRLPKKAVTQGLQTFYTALDFSSPDGSDVRSSLAQLLPEVYGEAFYASLNREYLITDTLKSRPSRSSASLGRWSGFVLPFLGQIQRKSVAQGVGYSTHTSGLVFGLEKESTAVTGLMWGIHGTVTQKGSLSFKTADNAHGHFQAWDLGLQMRYQPNNHIGLDMTAHVRFGLEQGMINRRIVFGSYAAEQSGKWLGCTSSSAVFGTYLWPLNPIVSMGPIVGLEYVTVTHPQIVERSSQGLDLLLNRTRFKSLRSSLGMRGVVFLNDKLNINLQARWDRELIHQKRYHGVAFLGYENEGFFFRQNDVAPFQSLYMSGQATYDINSKVSIGARAAAQFSRFARREFSGNLALKVQF